MLRVKSKYRRALLRLIFRFGLYNIHELNFKLHEFSSEFLIKFLNTMSSLFNYDDQPRQFNSFFFQKLRKQNDLT